MKYKGSLKELNQFKQENDCSILMAEHALTYGRGDERRARAFVAASKEVQRKRLQGTILGPLFSFDMLVAVILKSWDDRKRDAEQMQEIEE